MSRPDRKSLLPAAPTQDILRMTGKIFIQVKKQGLIRIIAKKKRRIIV